MSSSIYNYFRNLFSHQPNSSSDGSSNLPDHHVNGFRDPIWDTYETDESDVESRLPHGSMFSIYSNPLEIHRFFESRFDEMEQKMNVIMRDFATFDNFNQFSSLFGIPAFPPALEGPPVSDFLPALEGPSAPALEPSNKNIRDKLLKPGFQSGSSAEDRVDSDLDGRIASEEIGSLLDKRSSDIAAAPLVPFPSSPGDFTSYSYSHIRRTVRLPNGTIERVDIIRDGAGNENRTVTIKKPNGEETTVTTETPASGNTILPNGTSDGSRWWSW